LSSSLKSECAFVNEINWVTMSLASAIETTFETSNCSKSSNLIAIFYILSSLATSMCSSTNWWIRFCSSTILNFSNCSLMTRLGRGMLILTASTTSSSSCVLSLFSIDNKATFKETLLNCLSFHQWPWLVNEFDYIWNNQLFDKVQCM